MKIVVLVGGTSTERNVSIDTGHRVCESLRRNGHLANLLDVFWGIENPALADFFTVKNDLDLLSGHLKSKTADLPLASKQCFFGQNVLTLCQEADLVFMGLHGSNGEDGKVQAAFDLLGIRYTGTDYLSSAICMNKALTKKVLHSEGIPVPSGNVLHKGQSCGHIAFPCVIKPCCGGSSIGVSIVPDEQDFQSALDAAFSYESTVLVEDFIDGREFSVAVVDGNALPVIEIETQDNFYNYKSKYTTGAAKETCPAKLSASLSRQMQSLAEKSCRATGITTYARVDEILDKNGNIFCLEINTLPGMTDTSLLPQEAAAAGISYDKLVETIISVSLAKHENTIPS